MYLQLLPPTFGLMSLSFHKDLHCCSILETISNTLPLHSISPVMLSAHCDATGWIENLFLLLDISKQDWIAVFIKLKSSNPEIHNAVIKVFPCWIGQGVNANWVEQKLLSETAVLAVSDHGHRGTWRSKWKHCLMSGPGTTLSVPTSAPNTSLGVNIFSDNSDDQKYIFWCSELKIQIPQACCSSWLYSGWIEQQLVDPLLYLGRWDIWRSLQLKVCSIWASDSLLDQDWLLKGDSWGCAWQFKHRPEPVPGMSSVQWLCKPLCPCSVNVYLAGPASSRNYRDGPKLLHKQLWR